MGAGSLKKFAQKAKLDLAAQISARLEAVLASDSPERRLEAKKVSELEKVLQKYGRDWLVEQVAWSWFNRFCALRFMDLRGFTDMGCLSPANGQTLPEILVQARTGHIDEKLVPDVATRQRVLHILSGNYTSLEQLNNAYRILLIHACAYWQKYLPCMFSAFGSYANLLLPGDILGEKSVRCHFVNALNKDNSQDVQIIGWLYQYYISEKKDKIFADLKKNRKIGPENIPAATQLFTPEWIVRYLLENSLGRLWLQNRPDSGLAREMPYYIVSEDPATDFLKVNSPAEIKICDPACGSGHMLAYAFELLYKIYEEDGYAASEIPAEILQNNLYGIEIDSRAAGLAAFALLMKAADKQKSILKSGIKPHILLMEKVAFTAVERDNYMDFVGRDLFRDSLFSCMDQFEDADNFGALIRPVLKNAAELRGILQMANVSRQPLLQSTHEKVLKILEMAKSLSKRYHVVITNPPYMGVKNMNIRLATWARDNYPYSKNDLFAMFMERCLELALDKGYCSMVTMQNWMFLSSFEKLRSEILSHNTLVSMAHLGSRGFASICGEVVSTTAFIVQTTANAQYRGNYIRLVEEKSEKAKKSAILEAIHNPSCRWFFRARIEDFKQLPGSPVAYWVSDKIREIFANSKSLGEIADVKQGLATADNTRFVRFWHELDIDKICFNSENLANARESGLKWFPYNKGGDFRKWYGNQEHVVNWENDGEEIKNFKPKAVVRNPDYYFKESASWSKISTDNPAMRYFPAGFVFDVAGCSIFSDSSSQIKKQLCFANTKLARKLLAVLSPTLNFEVGHISSLPAEKNIPENIIELANKLISISKSDWDSAETSWGFTSLPLLSPDFRNKTLEETYAALRDHWRQMTNEMKTLEEENNRIFIEAHNLAHDLSPEVPLDEITLTCNPHYRYGGDKTESDLEVLLLADTMRELVSHAVGCMFGRYSLDRPGLILASQSRTLEDFRKLVPNARFMPTEDNVIPILDGERLKNDIVGRFWEFLRIAFGADHFAENLNFVEQGLGMNMRKYFLCDFYTDHIKRYKKRPIYWLFQSPGRSFSALIYMHRYSPDTVGIIQRDYLRKLIAMLEAEKDTLQNAEKYSPAAQTSQDMKKFAALQKKLAGLLRYEREIIHPLASRGLAIDLDDGVRLNYPKFGVALKKIPGLEAKG